MTDDTSPTVSRRRVLRALGASGAAAVGAAGIGAAQSDGTDYTAHMVIPQAEEFTDNYTGVFVFVEQQSTAELDAQEIANCDFDATWSPEELEAFNGRLVDQIENDHKDIPTQIYTKADSGVSPGALYVINRTYTCPEAYIGLGVEQIRSDDLPQNGTNGGETVTETTDGGGPGFGVAGAIAGVGGLAGLARALRNGEE